MIDCLLIGYNDGSFSELVQTLRSMGTDHPDYRDLNINFIEYNGKPYRALDIFDEFCREGRSEKSSPYHNADLLWTVIMYLGTYLSKNGFTFDYVNLFQQEKGKLREKLEKNDVLTVAVTTTVYTTVDPILEVIAFVRKYNKDCRIVVGGPFITKQAEQMSSRELQLFFNFIGADYYVLSREGEQTLANILKALKAGRSPGDVKNLAYKNGSRYAVTGTEQESNLLQENHIDYSLFPKEDIGKFINVRISKGCPYKCSYCGFPLRSGKYQTLDVEHIQQDLDAINKIGTVKSLFFSDDSVNMPPRKFKDMLRMMIRRQYDFSWHCFLRCDAVDEEVIGLMKEAKCEGVFLGLESANEQLLKNMNKTSRKHHFRKTVPLFKKAGMTVFASTFTGFPGETYETYRETEDFLKEIEADFYRHQLWYCDPITPIWREREKYGLKGFSFAWSHDTMDAKTACDLIERSFLTLDDPVWAPDPGFNFISVYYLKHRGLSIDQVKQFLRCFNAAVKEKLLAPHKKEPSPAVVESLRKSCRIDSPGEPDMGPVRMLAGTRYEEAADFWREESSGRRGTESVEDTRHQGVGTRTGASAASLHETIERSLAAMSETDMEKRSYLLLSAVVSLIGEKRRGDRLAFLVKLRHQAEPVPVQFDAAAATPEELRGRVENMIRRSKPYGAFSEHILNHERRYLNMPSPFGCAFIVEDETPWHQEWYGRFLGPLQSIPGIVRLQRGAQKSTVRIDYLSDFMPAPELEKMLDTWQGMDAALTEPAEDPEMTSPVPGDPDIDSVLRGYASKEFNF